MPSTSQRPCYFRDDKLDYGLHALLIGVSNYPFAKDGSQHNPERDNFGIGQLSTPARTVMAIAKWLVDHKDRLAFPLKSVRVVLAPSETEAGESAEMGDLPHADLAGVSAAAKDWQRDAAESKDGAALFYFAGHGIQRSRGDSVLLLADFLDPSSNTDLDRTINVENIYNGMGNFRSFPNLARTQFYFIDACHSDIESLAKFEDQDTAALFKVERGGIDDRIAPIFYSSGAGMTGWAPRDQKTLFGSDLLSCLEGGGAENVNLANGETGWVVTVGKLHDGMLKMVNAFNASKGYKIRSCRIDKFSPEALAQPLCTLSAPPTVRCTLDLHPPESCKWALLTFGVPEDPPITFPALQSPFECTKEAGIYTLGATFDVTSQNQYRAFANRLVVVMPPFFDYRLPFA
jgi:hypothetical protein